MPKDTLLHKAAYKGELSSVDSLLSGGEDVNVRGAGKRTPLHRAVGENNDDVVELLIERGADKNIQDGSGRTPLMWAAVAGAMESAKKLRVPPSCDLNVINKSGEAAIHLAAEAGKTDFVAWLIEEDCDAFLRSKTGGPSGNGATPIELAKANKHKEVIQLLGDFAKKKGKKSEGCVIL